MKQDKYDQRVSLMLYDIEYALRQVKAAVETMRHIIVLLEARLAAQKDEHDRRN